MSRAAAVWRDLQDALAVAEPNCEGDERFTADDTEHDGELIKVCAGCAVRELCHDWALSAPTVQRFGFFAGVSRRGGRDRSASTSGTGRALSDEQVSRIEQLRSEGMSIAAIAGALSLGTTTVARRLRQLTDTGAVSMSQ